MRVRTLLPVLFAAALALPLQAQFAITVQQNGQALTEQNGGSITINDPTVGQYATATVVVTYIGSLTANFPAAGQFVGNTAFTVTGGDGAGTVLTPGQSTTFSIIYRPTDTNQATGVFLWPYNETTTVQGVTTTASSGAITFNLIGTAPNLVVGQLTATGVFQPVASGGTIQFPNTTVNSTSSVTVGINNTGSGPGTVNSITVTGAGYQTGSVPALPLTINPGSQLNTTIQFQPTVAGSAPGSLQIAFANNTYTATLAGTGLGSFLTYTVTEGGTTSPLTPGQTIALGATSVGTPATAVVQFQNTGTTPYILSSVAISGTGFSLTDGPFLPVTIQPQQTNSITISYNPTQSGTNTGRLLIGSDSFTLSGQGNGAALTFAYQANGVSTPIVAGGTVSFSPVVDGQTASVPLTVTNTGTTAATLASIGVVDPTGVFTLSGLPALPMQLSSGASVSFTVNYSPVSSAISSATLAINNLAFGLTGFPATPPALPSYTFTGATGTQQPFQQPAIGLSLTTPYPYPVFGSLTLAIASGSFGADPAVQFASGGSQVTFKIPANTLQAVFPNGATQIQIQTGTVAGNITITPAFMVGTATGTNITPASPTTLQLTVPSQAPVLLTASIETQTTTSLSFSITGFSTTRSLEHFSFQLTAASGFTLSGGSFSVDVTAAATLWFQTGASESAGGQFSVTIPLTFSESGAAAGTNLTASISSISVTATNATGTSNAVQVPVP